MLIFLTILTLFALLTTLLPLSKNPHWVVRGMDFPRLQFASYSGVLLIAHFLYLDIEFVTSKVLIAITISCLLWQCWWIIPYTFLWPKEVKSASDSVTSNQLSILTSNVLMTNRNADALIELVNHYQPDVLVTLESDTWWENKLKVVEADMPYSVKCPLDNLYGMHIFSRLPFDEEEVKYLVEDEVPSVHALLTLRNNQKVRMHFLHPAPPSPTENTESAERDAELVIVARSVKDSELPVIVTGDFNDVAWSATTKLFREISGLLDPRVGRGMFNTFHASYPFMRWPLDHLFHSEHFTLKSIKRLPSIDSDHFPLFTRLTFAPSDGDDQQGLETSVSEEKKADDIVDNKAVSEKEVPEPGEKKVRKS